MSHGYRLKAGITIQAIVAQWCVISNTHFEYFYDTGQLTDHNAWDTTVISNCSIDNQYLSGYIRILPTATSFSFKSGSALSKSIPPV